MFAKIDRTFLRIARDTYFRHFCLTESTADASLEKSVM